jgi:cation diffusion facilitator CzcD-associated flavoprotein CzcO
VAPDTGTAIPEPGAIPRPTCIALHGTESCCRNGNGRSAIRSGGNPALPGTRAARHDLKRDICFNTTVTGAQSDKASGGRWNVRTDAGDEVTARFLITAVGTLSDTNLPPFEALERFRGKWYHTSRFPRGGVDFTAKRVAVVGTGASAVQAIPEMAQQAKRLTVFQRTPNYCLPARNGKVDPERVAARKADYDAIIERTRNSFAGFELVRIRNRRSRRPPRNASTNSSGCGTSAASSLGWATIRMCC